MVIRPLRADDVSTVFSIECASFTDSWDRSVFLLLARDRPVYSSALFGADIVRAFVLEDDTEVIGYVVWTEDFKTGIARVINIAVAPKRRQQGNGQMLMQFAFERLRAAGMNSVQLEARVSNLAARHLYEKMGMRAVHRVEGYYGDEDGIVYAMDL